MYKKMIERLNEEEKIELLENTRFLYNCNKRIEYLEQEFNQSEEWFFKVYESIKIINQRKKFLKKQIKSEYDLLITINKSIYDIWIKKENENV